MNPQSLACSPTPTDPIRYETSFSLTSKPNAHQKKLMCPSSVQITTCPSAPIPIQWTCKVSAINTPEAGASTLPSFKPSSSTNPHPWYILAVCIYFRVVHKPFALLAFVLSSAQWVTWGFLTFLMTPSHHNMDTCFGPKTKKVFAPASVMFQPEGFFISETETMPEDRQEP